jgi:fructokinase
VTVHGGIEGGGSKWECAVGTGPGDLRATETIRTTSPAETIGRAVAFFERAGPVDAVGIGSFGPLDRNPASPTWGYVTTTPKPGWAHTDVGQEIRRRLSVPVAFDTDVNASALGEHSFGAAQGLDTFCYITVGTGIGGGGMANGELLHGLLHPELGHMRIPHDRARDPFDGVCPYHGDCFEGLASGAAVERRWGKAGAELQDGAVWELEAEYLALGLVNVICALSPQLIILGGGVMKQPPLLPLVRRRVAGLLAGYLDLPELVAPALGDRAGVLGALELAKRVASV